MTRLSVASEGLGLLESNKEGKEQEVGSSVVLIPRESGGRPVHVPCLIQALQFPNTDLPFDYLLY
jgi:hypothetical protein